MRRTKHMYTFVYLATDCSVLTAVHGLHRQKPKNRKFQMAQCLVRYCLQDITRLAAVKVEAEKVARNQLNT